MIPDGTFLDHFTAYTATTEGSPFFVDDSPDAMTRILGAVTQSPIRSKEKNVWICNQMVVYVDLPLNSSPQCALHKAGTYIELILLKFACM